MKWTEQELLLLRELYPTTERKLIAAQLQRSMLSVRAMVSALGLKKRAPLNPWRPEEVEIVRTLFPAVGAAETAEALRRPISSVRAMAARMRVKMDSDPRSLPLGTERMMSGRLYRKVSMDNGFLHNWKPITSQLEESAELQDLYRLLESIHRETAAIPKRQPPSPSCASTC